MSVTARRLLLSPLRWLRTNPRDGPRRKGAALLEVLMAVGLLAFFLLPLTGLRQAELARHRRDVAADQLQRLVRGLEEHIARDRANLETQLAAADFVAISPEALAAGALLSGESLINIWDQRYAFYVLRVPRSPEPLVGLEGLVLAQGGRPAGTDELGAVMVAAGPAAGFIKAAGSLEVSGGAGLWQQDLPSGLAAVTQERRVAGVVSRQDLPEGSNNFIVRRQIAGRPELQTLLTSIDMNGHSLIDVGRFESEGLLASTRLESGPLTSNGTDFNDQMTVVGGITTGGSTTVQGDASVAGRLSTGSSAFFRENATAANLSTNLLSSGGVLRAATAEAVGLRVGNRLQAPTVSVGTGSALFGQAASTETFDLIEAESYLAEDDGSGANAVSAFSQIDINGSAQVRSLRLHPAAGPTATISAKALSLNAATITDLTTGGCVGC